MTITAAAQQLGIRPSYLWNLVYVQRRLPRPTVRGNTAGRRRFQYDRAGFEEVQRVVNELRAAGKMRV